MSNWNKIFKPIVVLCVICIVVTGALAATNGVTFAAIDPKRADEKMYDIYYEPLDADGQIVTTTTGDVKWN